MSSKKYYKLLQSQELEHAWAVHDYNVNIRSREIFLHGFKEPPPEEEEPGITFREAQKIEKNLTILNNLNKDPITIHMHTIGGNWRDGIAIYDAIMASPSPVTIVGYAQVRSMSSIIMQAGDLRIMMPNTDFLIHHGMSGYEGESLTVKSNVEWESKRLLPTMLKIYADAGRGSLVYGRKSRKHIKEALLKQMAYKGDWYLTSSEAVDHGFADGVLGTKGFETFEKLRAKKVKKRRKAI